MSKTNERGYYKRIGHKTYGPYYYPRETHYWTTKDLARIARHLKEQHNITPAEIMVMVATAVGLGTLFCKVSKSLGAALALSTFIKQLGTVLAFSQLTTVIIEFLLAVKLVAPKWLKIIVALLLAALVFINKLLDSINEMAENRETILEVTDVINEMCDKAKELAGIVVDKTCDAINDDLCYAATKKAEELAWLMKSDFEKAKSMFDETLMDELIELIENDIHDPDSWSSLDWN